MVYGSMALRLLSVLLVSRLTVTTVESFTSFTGTYTTTTTAKQQTTTDGQTQIRLVDGPDRYSGRVEVYYQGAWGTVCEHSFDRDDANVVCRMLGYTGGYAFVIGGTHFGAGIGPITIDELRCRGTEDDIRDCQSRKWLSHNCDHSEDVGVDCYANISLRLVNGPDKYSGRVEINYQGQWGTVCDDTFYVVAANVICGMLGYTDGHVSTAYFGAGTGPVFINDIDCRWHDLDIRTCTSNPWYGNNCDHSQDAGVYCYGTPTPTVQEGGSTTKSLYRQIVRLVDGPDRYSGRVEVYFLGDWGTVCDTGFDAEDARVICRTLGYTGGNAVAYGNAYFGKGTGPFSIENLECEGRESDIVYCQSGSWLSHDCSHEKDAGVSCYGQATYSTNQASYTNDQTLTTESQSSYSTNQVSYTTEKTLTTESQTLIRLVDGLQNVNEYSGRVEVYYQGTWGTICDDRFYTNDARVICNMLGFTRYNAVAYGGGHFGFGTGPITIDNLQCQGHEQDIRDCSSNPWLTHDCTHGEDAGVACTVPQTQIRLVDGPDRYSGRVEVYYQGTWGTICDDYFDRNDALVICSMLGYTGGHVVSYHNAYFGNGTGPITVDNLQCQGNEHDIRDCQSNTWLSHDCGHQEDAGVDCHGHEEAQTTESPTQIRLVDGPDGYSGRVEVYYLGNWGTVCDDRFDAEDARVICNMLGYTDGIAVAFGHVYFGSGTGPTTVDELRCQGHERDIRDCQSNTWLSHDCSHAEDAGVSCQGRVSTSTTSTTRRHTYTTSRVYHTTHPYWYYTTTPSWWYNTTLMTRLTTNGYSITDAVSVGCDENGWRVQLNMYNLRRLYPAAVASDIYLGDNSCTGVESGGYLTFHQGLRQCLTSEVARNSTLVYSNQLVYAQHDPVHPFIIRNYVFTLPIECDVDRNETSIGHLHHGPHSVTTPTPVVGHSHYSVSMAFYRDPNFQQEIRGFPLQVAVGERVYVKVFTQTADWTVKMRVHTCYTKPSQTSANNMRLDIIKDGCEVDTNTHLISQTSHETRFVFQDFEYTSNNEGIYLFCDATFCDTNDYTSACLQTCNP